MINIKDIQVGETILWKVPVKDSPIVEKKKYTVTDIDFDADPRFFAKVEIVRNGHYEKEIWFVDEHYMFENA